ncbi:MAG: hypothetical protein AB1679_16560 [Actinomycetota bacterium]|jgi:hypothetical protein
MAPPPCHASHRPEVPDDPPGRWVRLRTALGRLIATPAATVTPPSTLQTFFAEITCGDYNGQAT